MAAVLAAPSALAQPVDIEWTHQFGRVSIITGALPFGGLSIAADVVGNVYVAGHTEDGDITSGVVFTAFVRKYDAAGGVVWNRQMPDVGATGVSADASGVYVVGTIVAPLAFNRVFVRKYDPAGTELWTRQFGNLDFEHASASSVAIDAIGVYVAGVTLGTLPGQTSAGLSDAFVRKYDAAGTELWTRQFGTSAGDVGSSVAVDASGVYVAGSFVRKYDAAGTELWTRQFAATGVAVDASGVYLVGHTSGALPGQPNFGAGDAFVRKYDSAGTELWTRQFGTVGTDIAFAVANDASGLYVAGTTFGTFPGQVRLGSGDAFVQRLNAAGNIECWYRQFGSSDEDRAIAVAVDASGVYVAGFTKGVMPGQTSAAENDIFVAKLSRTASPVVLSFRPSQFFPPEGAPIMFTAIACDADGDPLTLSYDFQDDGLFDLTPPSTTAFPTYGWFDPTPLSTAAFHTYEDNGFFFVRVRVSDGQHTADALTFVSVFNVAPTVVITSPPAGFLLQVGGTITVAGAFTDPGAADTHTARWSFCSSSQCIQLTGSLTESGGSGTVTDQQTFTSTGVYQTTLAVTDDDGGTGFGFLVGELSSLIVVFDPNDGYVTGGGWIDSPFGAYVPNPDLTGRAVFGFVSKYLKGAIIPTGETEFVFRVANLNFHSSSYDWLVISGARAQYKGSGTINGVGDYGFILTAIDGAVLGGGGVDKFRIKIWDKATGQVIYDNQLGVSDSADPTIGVNGSIVIHKG